MLHFCFCRSEARPLNPNMEVEGRKNTSSFSSLVKDQYVANKMSAGPRVHGGDQYVPLDKRPVPPSAPNPTSHDAIRNPWFIWVVVKNFLLVHVKKNQAINNFISLLPVNIVSFQALGKTDVIYSFASFSSKTTWAYAIFST